MASTKSAAKSVRLDCDTWQHLQWIAETTGERVNDFIRDAVAQRLEGYPPRPTEIDVGQVTIDEVLDSW